MLVTRVRLPACACVHREHTMPGSSERVRVRIFQTDVTRVQSLADASTYRLRAARRSVPADLRHARRTSTPAPVWPTGPGIINTLNRPRSANPHPALPAALPRPSSDTSRSPFPQQRPVRTHTRQEGIDGSTALNLQGRLGLLPSRPSGRSGVASIPNPSAPPPWPSQSGMRRRR